MWSSPPSPQQQQQSQLQPPQQPASFLETAIPLIRIPLPHHAAAATDPDRDDDDDGSQPPPRMLLFDTVAMSLTRTADLFWIALHQLWVLSWMSGDDGTPSSPTSCRATAVDFRYWYRGVREAESDLVASRRRRFSGNTTATAAAAAAAVDKSTPKIKLAHDRPVHPKELLCIACGMLRGMMIEQRYIRNNAADDADERQSAGRQYSRPQLAYVIKPSLAHGIHRYLYQHVSDFRMHPGVPSARPIHRGGGGDDDGDGDVSAWDILFDGFPSELVRAHCRFMAHLLRDLDAYYTTTTATAATAQKDDDCSEAAAAALHHHHRHRNDETQQQQQQQQPASTATDSGGGTKRCRRESPAEPHLSPAVHASLPAPPAPKRQRQSQKTKTTAGRTALENRDPDVLPAAHLRYGHGRVSVPSRVAAPISPTTHGPTSPTAAAAAATTTDPPPGTPAEQPHCEIVDGSE